MHNNFPAYKLVCIICYISTYHYTASKNPEYGKLLEHSDTLITQLAAALCSGTLAQKLLAKSLITPPVYASVTNYGSGVTEEARIRAIIEYVLAHTKENS